MEYIFSRVKQHFVPVSLASVVKEAFFIVIFFILVGMLFTHVLSSFVSVNRPFFNFSYFLIPLVFFRWPMFITSIFIVLMDIMFSVSLSGMSAPAMFGLLMQVPEAGWFGAKILLASISFIIALSFCSFSVFKKASMTGVLLALIIITIPSGLSRYVMQESISTTGLPGLFFKHALGVKTDEFMYRRMTDWSTRYEPIHGGSFLQNEINIKQDKIIAITVESLGVPLSSVVSDFFTNKLFKSLSGRFGGFVKTDFQGTTINGEIRELCSLNMDGLAISSIPSVDNCIPNVLSKQGYQTYAYHNNSGRFYDRFIWYKEIGFSKFVDGDDLKLSGSFSLSHAFSGVDDRTVMHKIVSDLKGEDRFFAYWMTMDMHAPYSNIDIKDIPSLNCSWLSVSSTIECNYIKLLDNTLNVIVELANKMPDTKIVVSGDHMPRFFDVANPQVVKMLNSHYDDKHVLSFVISPQK